MQAFSEFAFMIFLVILMFLSVSLGYAVARIHYRTWDYATREPARQMNIGSELVMQISYFPGVVLWSLYSFLYLGNWLACIAGSILMAVAALIGMGLGSEGYEEIPRHVLNYNHKIKLKSPKKRKYHFDKMYPPVKRRVQFDRKLPNKKQGTRHEYWRGYGSYN